MPRRFWNDGQEVVFQDFNAQSLALERELYDRVVHELVGRVADGFFGESFKVEFASGTSVTVRAGSGFQTDNTQTSPNPVKRPLYLASDDSVSISSPDASLDRIDLITVQALEVNELTESRKFKDEITEVVSNQNLVVQKDWGANIVVVAGTPAASPVAPALPAGYLKLAEVYVTAVTGIANSSAITDSRAPLPVGGESLINTLGFSRLTASSGETVSSLMAEIDALLKNGYQEFTDFDDLGADPASPAASRLRLYFKGGLAFFKDNAGVVTPVGSGGGGGGGLVWTAPDGTAPLLSEEYGQDVYEFDAGDSQQLNVYFKVPESHVAGRALSLIVGIYSPSASNTILLQSTSRLIRQNNDAMDAPAASRVSTNSALTNTVAKQYRKVTLDITSATGQVGGFTVQPGDFLKIELTRGTDTDTAALRFVPTSTEIKAG